MNETLPPTLTIEMFLDEKVAREIEASGLQASLAGACESVLQDSMTFLGIPGTPRFQISAGIPPDWLPSLIVMNVNSQSVGSLPGGENRLLAVSLGRFLEPGEGGPALPDWLASQTKTGEAGLANPAIAYLAQLAKAALMDFPSILLGEEQTAAVQKVLGDPTTGERPSLSLDLDWLDEVLRTLLQARLSLADLDRLARTLEPLQNTGAVHAAESALAALLPQTIGLQVPRWLLEAYTLADERLGAAQPEGEEAPASPFMSLRNIEKDLFEGLGLNLPPLEFEVNDSHRQSLSFRTQSIASASWPALPPDTALVDAQPEQISQWGVNARPALHPQGGRLCGLIDAADAPHLIENGFTVWPGMLYLALCFSSQMQADRAALVHNRTVETWLSKLDTYLPELVKAVRAEYGGEMQAVLTRALRRLVDQGISMNRLPQILEGLLDARVLAADPETHVIFGDGMPVLPQMAAGEWRSDPQVLADYAIWYIR